MSSVSNGRARRPTPRLTIVGLGPGYWHTLTVEAATILEEADTVYVRTALHPSLEPIRAHLANRSERPSIAFRSFDHIYEELTELDDIYGRIVEELAVLVQAEGQLVYAVPGSPAIGEPTVRLLQEHFAGSEVEIRLVPGLSYVEPVLMAAGVSDAGWIEVLDAGDIALFAAENAVGEVPGQHRPLLPWRAPVPTAPMLISSLHSREIAGAVKLWLDRFYPVQHRVVLVHAAGTPECLSVDIALYELDSQGNIGHDSAVYVPALTENDNLRTFAGLMQLTRRLRGPGGCPWDREQSHASLKPHLLEEAYEVIDALDTGDPTLIAEELGDLLFQITIHSQVAAEAGTFTIEDVIQNIMVKLIGRHPHVFGDVQLDSAQDVRQVWEALKQKEKPKRTSILEQIPRGLPAVPQANLMQKRAAGVGFSWLDVGGALGKVEEELLEFRDEIAGDASRDHLLQEFGDILFALIAVARQLKLDPEEALRGANRKFASRFGFLERVLTAEGKTPRDLSFEALMTLWERAKHETQTAT